MKLEIELVPKTAWFTNLRSRLPKAQWDVVRKKCYEKANYRCEICGGKGTKHPVECHEKWNFGDGKITLIGLIALCPSCHEVKHIGLAGIRGRGEIALRHFMRVNEVSRHVAEKYVKEGFDLYHERSKREKWELDVRYLDEYLSKD
ncbi:homing endonuclease [Escherichia phage AV124]|nr:homing endonuclease [Escherichia phage AV124]